MEIKVDSSLRITFHTAAFGLLTDNVWVKTPTDPTTIAITITDSNGAVNTTLALGDLTKVSDGIHYYDLDTSSSAPTGTWTIDAKAVVAGLDEVSNSFFNVK